MNRKEEQLASSIRRVLGDLISRGLSDPRIRGMVSITEVRLMDRGRVAEVWVSVLPAEDGPVSLRGLNHAAAHLRKKVGQTLRLRLCPEIRFVLDESLKTQADVLGAIQDAVASDARNTETRTGDQQEPNP